MRLSILALFIALPAAAYAAVTTRQVTCTPLESLVSFFQLAVQIPPALMDFAFKLEASTSIKVGRA
ncbi:hypothetical protein BJV77DRAFT_1071476 [Russula vinacea]|nr:hypothetical protein BJV77DRAFT_1071476 [Russula vinacea]